MKIILNKEEQKQLSTILNCENIKQIEFETSYIYIRQIAKLLTELINDISKSYRVGYRYNSKKGRLLFLNNYQKIDEDVIGWLYD